MKKALPFLLLLFSMYSKAQIYHPFPESDAVWNIRATIYCHSGPAKAISVDYSIVMKDDTLINGVTYRQLWTPLYQWEQNLCGPNPPTYNIYRGAIRQNTSLKKVFIVAPATATENLLYDFTMQEGDTVKGYLSSIASAADTVISIDSVLVGGVYHKRINLNLEYKISLIEGVGCTYGLVVPTVGRSGHVDRPEINITCFKQNEKSLYPSTTVNCKTIVTLVKNDENTHLTKVFPNPSNGSFIVEYTGFIKQIKIINLLGKEVMHQEGINEKNYQINNLTKGTYILTLTDDNNQVINKRITCLE